MNSRSREHIFSRLYSTQRAKESFEPKPAGMPVAEYSQEEKINRLKSLMEAVRTEVHVTKIDNWVNRLKDILKEKRLKTLLYAPETEIGKVLEKSWEDNSDELPVLQVYESHIEDFKEKLFGIDAGITSTIGGIAETGAVILWPTEKEPRLMSLVPPVHIAVLKAERIYNTFGEAIQKENWPARMPTNALLISGPSKTADIELTLAFGVHGPKELVVFILTP